MCKVCSEEFEVEEEYEFDEDDMVDEECVECCLCKCKKVVYKLVFCQYMMMGVGVLVLLLLIIGIGFVLKVFLMFFSELLVFGEKSIDFFGNVVDQVNVIQFVLGVIFVE